MTSLTLLHLRFDHTPRVHRCPEHRCLHATLEALPSVLPQKNEWEGLDPSSTLTPSPEPCRSPLTTHNPDCLRVQHPHRPAKPLGSSGACAASHSSCQQPERSSTAWSAAEAAPDGRIVSREHGMRPCRRRFMSSTITNVARLNRRRTPRPTSCCGPEGRGHRTSTVRTCVTFCEFRSCAQWGEVENSARCRPRPYARSHTYE